MSETARSETQLGIADLKRRLSAVGLSVLDEHEKIRRGSFYFAIGNTANQTDIVLSREFLDDLPNTKDYHPIVDSYARAVAGRLKCGPPELFCCKSGVPIHVSFRWPIHSGVYQNEFASFLLMDVTNTADGKIAKCSVQLGGGAVFAVVLQAVNSVRSAVDGGQIKFYEPTVHQEVYQRAETKEQPQEPHSQEDVELFVATKTYTLGFIAVEKASEVWAVDPWDAQYLGVTVKHLSLAMRVLRAKGLLEDGAGPEYVLPTDKLLAEQSSRATKQEESFAPSQQKLSHKSPPNKDEMLEDVQNVLKQHSVFALVVVDVDNFKSVNDSKGHPEGNACLDKVIGAIETVVGRRGKVYRWGGDEFAICLPDFCTAEAVTTSERIRAAVEQAKAGGDIEVTSSIGVCGSDCTDSKSAEEFFDFADKAMYTSKHSGKNRVTAWPLSSAGCKIENTPIKRPREDERRKLAETVVLSIKTDNGHQRNYTIRIKNHSKEVDVAIKRISLWSDGQRVGEPAFRPEGANGKCWDVAADREIPFNFDAGEVVAKRLWSIAGAPSMSAFHDTNLLKGHFRSKVCVEVLYEVVGIEKQYDETRTVQVDPINNVITPM